MERTWRSRGSRRIRDILEDLVSGRITIEEAERSLRAAITVDLEGFVKLDVMRDLRRGVPEAIMVEGKDPEIALKAFIEMAKRSGRAIATRCTREFFDKLDDLGAKRIPDGYDLMKNEIARIAILRSRDLEIERIGSIGLLAAGTSDIPIAEEARIVAEELGCEVHYAYDVGIAGVHRLYEVLPEILDKGVCAIIVVAGMEGALPSLVASLVDVPVIGVPTSRGYGAGGGGIAALLSMLQSCSPGLAVVNIDNGFGAAVFAYLIARTMRERCEECREKRRS